MSAKNLLIDFISMVVLIALIAFVLFYLILGNRFDAFVGLMRSLAPIAIFLILFLVVIKIKRIELNKKSEFEGDKDIVIHLRFMDLLKWDIIVFLTPVIFLLIALAIDEQVVLKDVIQAIVSLLIMYFCKKKILANIEI